MKEYFELQYTMTNRRFKDSGFEPLLAYLILLVGFFGISIYLFNRSEFAEYIYVLSALTLIGKLSEIRRTEFLQLCFGDTKMKAIRITENLFVSFPFLIILLYKQHFLSALLLFVLTIILALVNFRTTLNFIIWTPFAKEPFEFTTGFRNTFYLIFTAYALAVVSVIVNNFNLGVFAFLLMFVTTISYYSKPENEYYVWTYNLNPRQFLFSKIKTALLFSTALALPIALIITIFFHHNIGMVLLLLLIGWAFQIFIIVSKYSSYPDDMNIIQGVIFALSIWFPPMLIFIIPFLFQKSEKRLSNLLK